MTLNLRRPAASNVGASGAEHFFKKSVHLFFFNKFAPVGIGFAFQHRCTKTGILIEKPQRGVFQKFTCVALAGVLGKPRKLGFLLGCEWDFLRSRYLIGGGRSKNGGRRAQSSSLVVYAP